MKTTAVADGPGAGEPGAPPPLTINLADARLGAAGVWCTDEFFAPLARMLQPAEPVFIPGKYDDHGKWMDGWESRRRRGGGHDRCVVRLAAPGAIHAVDVDTRHFTGNYPPAASLEACLSTASGDPGDGAGWVTLAPPAPLGPDAHHLFPVADRRTWSHVRLNLLPDGGVARLRVYGRPRPDWNALAAGGPVDLASAVHGAVAVAWNDAHYGNPGNMLRPDRGRDMGDGWETRRRREPGYDWCIIALAHPGAIDRVVVDTAHFKGNYPDRCSLQGALLPADVGAARASVVAQSMFWPVLLPEQPLRADREHTFAAGDVTGAGPVSHVRVNMIPDGGISRLRLFGAPA